MFLLSWWSWLSRWKILIARVLHSCTQNTSLSFLRTGCSVYFCRVEFVFNLNHFFIFEESKIFQVHNYSFFYPNEIHVGGPVSGNFFIRSRLALVVQRCYGKTVYLLRWFSSYFGQLQLRNFPIFYSFPWAFSRLIWNQSLKEKMPALCRIENCCSEYGSWDQHYCADLFKITNLYLTTDNYVAKNYIEHHITQDWLIKNKKKWNFTNSWFFQSPDPTVSFSAMPPLCFTKNFERPG